MLVGQMVVDVVINVDGQSELMQVIAALCPAPWLAGCLHSGEQQGNQNPNNGDHHQQFNQRKSPQIALSHDSPLELGQGL